MNKRWDELLIKNSRDFSKPRYGLKLFYSFGLNAATSIYHNLSRFNAFAFSYSRAHKNWQWKRESKEMGISPAKFIGSDLLKLFGRKPDFLEILFGRHWYTMLDCALSGGKTFFCSEKMNCTKQNPTLWKQLLPSLKRERNLERLKCQKLLFRPPLVKQA